jgi:hypothetical protein
MAVLIAGWSMAALSAIVDIGSLEVRMGASVNSYPNSLVVFFLNCFQNIY